VTSSVTSPFDCHWPLSYRLQIGKNPLSATVSEIFDLKVVDIHTQNSTRTDIKGQRSRTNTAAAGDDRKVQCSMDVGRELLVRERSALSDPYNHSARNSVCLF